MKNILIVEDKEIHRKTLMKLLEGIEDIQVFVAATVEEAYVISMENTIHLFLVDIILNTDVRGDVSGLKFVETIRGIHKYKFSPLIFITSLEDPELYAYKELHCFGYIEKPFNPKEVINMVKLALEFPEKEKKDKNIYLRIILMILFSAIEIQ